MKEKGLDQGVNHQKDIWRMPVTYNGSTLFTLERLLQKGQFCSLFEKDRDLNPISQAVIIRKRPFGM